MTLEARINLQKGVPENKLHKGTNYNIESLLDSYLVQKKRIKDSMQDQEQMVEAYVKEIVDTELQDCLEKALSEVLDSFSDK